MFVILDNVVRLPQNDLLQILNLSESFGHSNVSISFLLISQDKEWNSYKNQEIIQRIHNIVKINPYSFENAFKILQNKCEFVFKENVVSEDLLVQLAQICSTRNNLRYGIAYLRKLGIYADKEGYNKITPEMLNKLPKETYFEYLEIIEKLRIPELLIYTSVLLALNNSETTTVERCYLEYNKLCEEYNKKSYRIITFGRSIRKLAKFNLIAKELKHYPIVGGGYSEISLPYNSNGFKKEVELYLKQKLT